MRMVFKEIYILLFFVYDLKIKDMIIYTSRNLAEKRRRSKNLGQMCEDSQILKPR